MAKRPDLFDLNDSKTIGLFKDETPGNVITESYHIRAKSYHYVLADKSTKSKHKGVSKKSMNEIATDTYLPSLDGTLLEDPVDNTKVFDPMTQVYRDCLFNKEVFHAKNVGIRSKDHKALCPIDTKRWILSDGITSLPYYHWRNKVYKNMVKDSIPHEEGAIRAKLPEKYQNKCTSHISSSLA